MDNSNNYPQVTDQFASPECWDQVEGSSNIKERAYNPETKTLAIRFHHGGEYRYASVPEDLAEMFFLSVSAGSFFHQNIKNNFVGVKFEGVPEEPTETRFERQRELETEATGKLESEETADDGELF